MPLLRLEISCSAVGGEFSLPRSTATQAVAGFEPEAVAELLTEPLPVAGAEV